MIGFNLFGYYNFTKFCIDYQIKRDQSHQHQEVGENTEQYDTLSIFWFYIVLRTPNVIFDKSCVEKGKENCQQNYLKNLKHEHLIQLLLH